MTRAVALSYCLRMILSLITSNFKTNKLVWVVFFLGVFLRVYHLNLEILEPYNNVSRQSIVASVARNFYRHGFNFFYPELDENGGGPSLYNAEMPIHSYLMAVGYKISGGVKPWAARTVPVAFSLGTLFFLYGLGKHLYGRIGGLAALLFAALSPLNLALSRALQPESLMIFATTGVFYFYFLYERTAKRHFHFLSTFCLFLATASKAYNLYLVLPLAYLFWTQEGPQMFRRPRNYLYAAAAALALLWYLYAWKVSLSQDLAHYPFKYSQRGPAGMTYLQLLFSWPYLRLCAKIFLVHILTPVGAIFFFAGFFTPSKKREDVFLWVWFGCVGLLMILLWRIVIEHSYYQLPFVPVSALFIAKATQSIFSKPGNVQTLLKNRVFLVFMILIETASLLYFYRGLYEIPKKRFAILEAGKAVQKLSNAETLVAASFETSSIQLYYCDRKGWPFGILNEPEDALIVRLEKYRAEGARLFVATSLEDFEKVPRFRKYLRENYRTLEERPGYWILDLGYRGSSRSPS